MKLSQLITGAAIAGACHGEQKDAAIDTAPATATAAAAAAVDTGANTQSPDTTRVIAHGDGLWGAAFAAVEVLRLAAGRPETEFGMIRDVVARPDGGVLVFDAKGVEGLVLRSFDANGRFERNIGKSGSGPGEYSSDRVRLTVQPDGTILLHEGGRVVNRYGADGTYLNSFKVLRGEGRVELFRARNNTFYTPIVLQPAKGTVSQDLLSPPSLRDRHAMPADSRLYRYDSAGTLLDSIVFRDTWLQSSASPLDDFAAGQWWFPLADGRVIVTRTDKLGFLRVDLGRKSAPLVAEIPLTKRIPLSGEELAERESHQQSLNKFHEGSQRSSEPRAPGKITNYKLPAGLPTTDMDGRIWVEKHMASTKVEPYCVFFVENRCTSKRSYRDPLAYVAFTVDGTYLGEVRFPDNVISVRFHGDFAWAKASGADDELQVVKFRIHR